MGHPAIDIDTLSPEERLDLLDVPWDEVLEQLRRR
jgi:hypothetical protein